MATATWVKEILEKRGITYEETHHPVAFTAQQVAQSEHISGNCVAKVVVAMANGRPVELILPASRTVVLDHVADCSRAGCCCAWPLRPKWRRISPTARRGRFPLYAAGKMFRCSWTPAMSNVRELVFQAGTHEDAIRLQLEDWLTLVTPRGVLSQSRSIPRARRLSQAAKTWGLHVRIAGRNHRLKNRKHESGQPGGGQGRIEVVGKTGVYPGSGPYPPGEAAVRTPVNFVHGQRDEQGREVEGGSELIYLAEGDPARRRNPPHQRAAAASEKRDHSTLLSRRRDMATRHLKTRPQWEDALRSGAAKPSMPDWWPTTLPI